MKTIDMATNGWSKRDSFNAKAAQSLNEIAGKVITVKKLAIGTDLDENAQDITTATFITEEGVFGTISATAINMCEDLVGIIDEEGAQKVKINMRKSNGGRDYIVLELVD